MEGNIELRSEKVRNIIGQIPPMLLRHGAAIIGAALLAMVSISVFIPYQESVHVEVTISTTPAIREINAVEDGIFVHAGAIEKSIEAGGTVGYLYHRETLSPIITPISGRVVFNAKSREAVSVGSLICIVIPRDSLYYYGAAEISVGDKSRIAANSKVILQTTATEDIIGYMREISPLASSGNRHKVVIDFRDTPHSLLTPYEKLSGKVIISQTTILKRFINSLKISRNAD